MIENFEGLESQTSNVEFYERFAPFYGQVYGEMKPGAVVRQWVALLEELGYIPEAEFRADRQIRLIDIGCGPGWHLPEWSKAGFQVAGIDSSGEMLRLAERHFSRSCPGEKCSLYQADIREIENQDVRSQFDLAVSHFNFLNLFAPECLPRVFAGVTRLLCPGGLWITDYCEATECLGSFDEETIWEGASVGLSRRRFHLQEGCYVIKWTEKGLDIEEKYWLKGAKAINHGSKGAGFQLIDRFEWRPDGGSQAIQPNDSILHYLALFRLAREDYDWASKNMGDQPP